MKLAPLELKWRWGTTKSWERGLWTLNKTVNEQGLGEDDAKTENNGRTILKSGNGKENRN